MMLPSCPPLIERSPSEVPEHGKFPGWVRRESSGRGPTPMGPRVRGGLRPPKNEGMTLIELLVVFAIIGILGAVALAFYRSQYIVKARLSEVTNSMAVVASSVHSFYMDYNRFPSAADAAIIKDSLGVSLPSGAGTRFSGMTVEEGVITATITNIDSVVDGKTLVLRPSTDQNGVVYWQWDGTVPPVYYPKR